MTAPTSREFPVFEDTLGESLYLLRLNGTLYCQSELSAPWGIDMPQMPGKMMFHIVTEGQCLLSVPDSPIVTINPGELALVPAGQGHTISSSGNKMFKPLFDIRVTQVSERFEHLRFGAGGEETSLVCGVISLDEVAGRKLLEQLPSVIHIDGSNRDVSQQIKNTVEFMAAEAAHLQLGGETILAHLADILVIKAIRHWVDFAPEAQRGWLGAIKDPKIGKALTAIHAQPEFSWTVDSLAREAGMSRSGFSARFSEVLGTSVKQYLTSWRMNLARAKIMSSSASLADLAEELGYQSEAAFSRAYKRVMGESPIRHVKAE